MVTRATRGDPVMEYYERNTPRFLRSRGGASSSAFHRKLWAPGVRNAVEALLYLDTVVSDILSKVSRPAKGRPRILDLGCGVGGTALRVAERLDADVTGISNSALQVSLARKRAKAAGLPEQCRFVEGDFLDPPPLPPFHGAFAIESFAHSESPEDFFAAAERLLVPGGVLILCDDFLAEGQGRRGESRFWVERFKRGWRLRSLLTASDTARRARERGFVPNDDRDLTPLVGAGPLNGRFARRVARRVARLLLLPIGLLPSRSPFWGNLAGGAALRHCIASGYTEYRCLVFMKKGKSHEKPRR